MCVCVCPLHAAQGLATSRTVLRHPPGAPHVMDCYLCGREFDTRILNNHEDECIKHWRKWNSSLPLDQRQPEPARPEFKFNKGHLYLLIYACIAGLSHRGSCPYFCRLIYIWTDFHFEYETTARLTFHCFTFAHEGKSKCGSGEFLKESFVMPDESSGRITHYFIVLQAQDSGILQAFVLKVLKFDF